MQNLPTEKIVPALKFYNTVKSIFISHSRGLSRTQIQFLVYCSTLDLPHFRTLYLKKLGIPQQIGSYYLIQLYKKGYLVRLKRGCYVFSDKANVFLAAFYADYIDRLNKPYSWQNSVPLHI